MGIKFFLRKNYGFFRKNITTYFKKYKLIFFLRKNMTSHFF